MSDAAEDRERWRERYAHALADRAPSGWVMAACARIPPDVTIVDVAAGDGRHAIALAQTGRQVIAVDFVEEAIGRAVRGLDPAATQNATGTAAAHGNDATRRVHGIVADVWALPIRPGAVGAVLVANFLERDLFDELKALLRPGGYLVYETYTDQHRLLVDQGRSRAPRSPRYLLSPGELAQLVAPLTIIDTREGYVNDAAGERYCASVLAVNGRESPYL